jgi:transportin-1
MRACNNACWSLGELAIRLQPAQVTPWAASVAERVAGLLAAGASHLPHSLLENAAITLGRVACQAPDLLAPHLTHFLVPWCQVRGSVHACLSKPAGCLVILAAHSLVRSVHVL